jgi:cytochrome P450
MAALDAAARPPLAMRRDPCQPLDPAPELLAVDEAGGITEISMPIVTPGPGRTWLVTRPEDIRAVLGDPELFSNVLHLPPHGPGGSISPTGPGSLPGLDPPQHTRLRRLLSAEFSARRIADLRIPVEATAQEALAAIRGQDRADLVSQVAQPVPAVVIAELLGVPPTDRAEFCRRSAIALDTRLAALARAENRVEMLGYMGELVARLRREPGDGLLGALITRHGSDMSDAELVATGNMLLLAGHETTASLIAQSLLLLIQHPRHRETMLRDEASLVRGVEELLRYLTVFHFSFPRTAQRTTGIAGTLIEAGDRILCSFPVAHRDQRRYRDADEFQPLREVASHLAFGHGIHYCLGAPLARLEMRIVLPAFFESFPAAKIDSRTGVRYRDGSLAFGLEALPVMLRGSITGPENTAGDSRDHHRTW